MGRLPKRARGGRSSWKYTGERRPPFADEPRLGQESVWDFPRPPRVEREARAIVVRLGKTIIAQTTRGCRVLETASPPTYYIPPNDIVWDLLSPSGGRSRCEWKGVAVYWDLVLPERRVERVAWAYPEPFSEFEMIRGHLAFFASRLECYLGGERVRPQPGLYYGGWITFDLAGPFKGGPGTEDW